MRWLHRRRVRMFIVRSGRECDYDVATCNSSWPPPPLPPLLCRRRYKIIIILPTTATGPRLRIPCVVRARVRSFVREYVRTTRSRVKPLQYITDAAAAEYNYNYCSVLQLLRTRPRPTALSALRCTTVQYSRAQTEREREITPLGKPIFWEFSN